MKNRDQIDQHFDLRDEESWVRDRQLWDQSDPLLDLRDGDPQVKNCDPRSVFHRFYSMDEIHSTFGVCRFSCP